MLVSIRLFTTVWEGGILTMHAAGWDSPFGITFVADVFSSSLVLLTSFSGLAVSVFSATGIARGRIIYGYFPIFHRSEEHTSELQSLMRISYAVFCLKKTIKNKIPQ